MNVAADVRAPQRVHTATGRGRGPSLMGHHRDQLIEFLNALSYWSARNTSAPAT
jgi:hypothetical protein